jgi:hypothetical protein
MASVIKSIDFPTGATAKLSIIDTEARLTKVPAKMLMGPVLDGLEFMPLAPSWSFLIESPTGKNALFDLGISKNLQNFSPAVHEILMAMDAEIKADKDVAQVLTENGFPLEAVGSIILRRVFSF